MIDIVYTFIFYIMGCVGPTCDIPAYEVYYFESEKTCEAALSAWKASDEYYHKGHCLFGIIEPAPKGLFDKA